MYTESDLLPLSALQHFLYCPRQCALIHLEQTWVENLYTAEGRILHERVDQGGESDRGQVRIAYSLAFRSLELGVSGKADVVEFHRLGDGAEVPYPVEYKRGRSKKGDLDRVQLCAQGLCLEEMLKQSVPEGALFYGKTRRRERVVFDDALRILTRQTAVALHAMVQKGKTPPATYVAKRCDPCSFIDVCMPKTIGKRKSAKAWIDRMTRKL